MAGNSQRRGAMRREGTKKGATVGSGGQRRAKLTGRGPTPKATERPHHPAARRERAAKKRAEAGARKGSSRSSSGRRSGGSVLMGRNPVVEALRAGIPASALYVQAKSDADDRWREAMRIAVATSLPIMEVAKSELDRMTDGGVHHLVSPRATANHHFLEHSIQRTRNQRTVDVEQFLHEPVRVLDPSGMLLGLSQ
jgi:23S rRNA (guanosine2251-2'-O)-methyltransferase